MPSSSPSMVAKRGRPCLITSSTYVGHISSSGCSWSEKELKGGNLFSCPSNSYHSKNYLCLHKSLHWPTRPQSDQGCVLLATDQWQPGRKTPFHSSFSLFTLKFFTWIPVLQSSQVMLVSSGAAQVGPHIQSAWWEVGIDCELRYIFEVRRLSCSLQSAFYVWFWGFIGPTSGFQYSGQSKVAMPAQNPGRFAFKQRVSVFLYLYWFQIMMKLASTCLTYLAIRWILNWRANSSH